MHFKLNLPTPPPEPSLPQATDQAQPDVTRGVVRKRRSRSADPHALTLPDEQPAAAEAVPTGTGYTLSNKNELGLPLLLLPLPESEAFSSKYTFQRGAATVPMVTNEEALGRCGPKPPGPLAGLAAYEELYPALVKPSVMPQWLTDESFGEQRLSGLNPGMLRRVGDLSEVQGLDRAALDQAMNGETLPCPLFAIDYTQTLAHVQGGHLQFGPHSIAKYCPKPVALFRWAEPGDEGVAANEPQGRLLPVAIQIDLDEDGAVRTLTPRDPHLDWTLAKICFGIADANVHEMCTHLGRAHFAMEAFGGVTPQQLSPSHPLHILLAPHLRFLVVNNQAGVDRLVQKGGPVDLLLAGSREESLALAIAAARGWTVGETFRSSLAERGVDDAESLPHYPFRDDGLLIWEAIQTYVGEYLALYYPEDAKVAADHQLQAWAAQLANREEGGGYVAGMPSELESVEQLAAIVTQVIYHSSAGHSSINYSQYPFLGFSPNQPLAGYANYQSYFANQGWSDKDKLQFLSGFLPPDVSAVGQIGITFSLSAYQYDELGDYGPSLADPLARQVAYRFAKRLAEIECTIEERNRRRHVPYTFLMPSNILNSASI